MRNLARRVSQATAIGICVATAAAAVGGCSGLRKAIDHINNSDTASGNLQSFISQQLTTKFHRHVQSVTCRPQVQEVLVSSRAHLTCVVRFTNGSSYTTPATITNPSTDPDLASYNFSFNDPPGSDITTAPLPRPTVSLSATSPSSFLVARNLARVVRQLTARFGTHDLIIQMAIYPGEVQAVVAANGMAWPVSATSAGPLKVGPRSSFNGSRSGIGFSQLVPGVITGITRLIVSKAKIPLSRIDRFVLTNSLPHGDSGWNIYLTSGTTRFQCLVMGQDLIKITPSGPS